MKNCGFSDLRIVNPQKYKKDEAYKMACFAKDIVDKMEFYPTLLMALADISTSVAFARRVSKTRAPYYYLDEISKELVKRNKKGRMAFVFGRETDGLTNDEIHQCDLRVSIPTCEPNGSLNLAQAVLLACYEIFKKSSSAKREKKEFFVAQSEMRPMIADFDKLMFEIGYDDRDEGQLRGKITAAFKDICCRAGLKEKEVNMFYGIWASVREVIKKG
jgi:TrmH family RNA methyltransferase